MPVTQSVGTRKSKKYDNRFEFTSARAFDDVADAYTGSANFKDGKPNRIIPMGIKSSGIAVFQNVPIHVGIFSLIEIDLHIQHGSVLYAKLRNIPITR